VPPDDPEDADPGLSRERTRLAWSRTAIAFAALGGAMLRREVAAGLVVLATTPLVWGVGRFASRATQGPRPGRLLVVTLTVTAVSVLAAIVALVGPAPASLSQLFPLHG